MKKMTYVDALNLAIANLSALDYIYDGANTISADATIDKLTALRDTLVNRATAPRKPSAKAIEAQNFRELVEDYILNKGYSTFTAKKLAQELNTTTQKVSAALTVLVKIGVFVKGDDWYEVAGE